jgi:hypothetical protein
LEACSTALAAEKADDLLICPAAPLGSGSSPPGVLWLDADKALSDYITYPAAAK